jgi:hypothetical protein
MRIAYFNDATTSVLSEPSLKAVPVCDEPQSSQGPQTPDTPWNYTTSVALLTLVLLWAWKLYTTWGAWGDLTIDSGHEMYVPSLLSQGKQLYRDVWFMYGPAAPYFTSFLFRLFGVNLNVLYWAGSLSALGSAIFLFLIGVRLSSWLIGWTAGAVILLEAFQPSLFCFPLPYTSAAVYGCFVGCLFLWLVIHGLESSAWGWMFSAGSAAAVALLLKPEFGTACYTILGLMSLLRCWSQRSWKILARDALAILPGVVLCGLVWQWMVSIAGVDFITHENLVFWPSSYFMRTYGKMWLAKNGFAITVSSFLGVLIRAMPVAAALLISCWCLWWKRADKIAIAAKVTLVLAFILYGASFFDAVSGAFFPSAVGLATLSAVQRDYFSNAVLPLLNTVFFPRDMVLYVAMACGVAWIYFWLARRCGELRGAAIPLILTFSSLLAFRFLMNMSAHGYPIFYNGPVVLSFLLIAVLIVPRSGRSRRFVFVAEFLICLGCLTPVAMQAWSAEQHGKDFVPLTTERGAVRVPKLLAENYKVAIQFMKAKASLGQSVLSVPEDTSLYFLSDTYAPTRLFLFTPGVLAPGKMTDEMIREIDQKPVSYLIWSNRTYYEFGVPIFGKDFDQEIGDYLKSHFHRVARLTSPGGNSGDWSADLWERN